MTLIVPVILCGGSGTRLWPASRDCFPKQFLKMTNEHSLLQNTVLRALKISSAQPTRIITVTLDTFYESVIQHLTALAPQTSTHVLKEPASRNTAAAVAYATLYAETVFGPDAILCVLPADHYIRDEDTLSPILAQATQAACNGYIVTLGIKPTRPDTGYGYIQAGPFLPEYQTACKVIEFVEKPNLKTAEAYLRSKQYLWNSGMFIFKVSDLLKEYKTHAPDILASTASAITHGPSSQSPSKDIYESIRSSPFDKAILEKSKNIVVIPWHATWSDIGTWQTVWELKEKDTKGNALSGHIIVEDTQDCLIESPHRLIACAGIENLVIIDTGDALLIADRRNGESLRGLVSKVKEHGRPEISFSRRNKNAI